MSDNRCIQIFCKAPVPGLVKTRLAPVLGDEGACNLYRRMAGHVIQESSKISGVNLQIWCAPNQRHEFFQDIRCDCEVTLHGQRGSGLGERMFNAASHALGSVGSVVIIGTDVPAMSSGYLEKAFQSLEQSDVVLGPAADGGYVLIGLRSSEHAVFSDIDWGTPGVLAQTRERVAELGWKVAELEPLWDVDRPEDLDRLRNPEYAFLLEGIVPEIN